MRIIEFPGAPASEGEKHASVNASSNNIADFEYAMALHYIL